MTKDRQIDIQAREGMLLRQWEISWNQVFESQRSSALKIITKPLSPFFCLV